MNFTGGFPTTLVLKHNDISATTTTQTVDNSTGGWSNYKQTVYWYVNLKTLLGADWDKYETFCIRLNQVTYSSVAYPTSATLDINWVTYMSGLNWVNSSYNQATNSNTNKAPLTIGVVAASAQSLVIFNPTTCTNFFRKGDNQVKIQLEHFRTSDGTIIQSTVGLPHSAYHFDVWGVK